MDTKLLLVKAITLLYMEGERLNNNENSADTIKAALETLKDPDVVVSGDFGHDVISSLKQTAKWMVSNPATTVYEYKDFIQRIQLDCQNDPAALKSIDDAIRDLTDEDEGKKTRRMNMARSAIRNFVNGQKALEVLKGYYNRLTLQRGAVDWKRVVGDIRADLEPLEQASGDDAANMAMINTSLCFSDLEALGKAFSQAKDELDTRGIIRFGWQGLNRMFGSNMGARRGEFIVVGALQHSFKSGFALETMKQAALYNKPFMRNADKTPCLIRMSLENTTENDVMHLYKSLVENETGLFCDPKLESHVTMAKYVSDKLRANGYETLYYNVNPTDLTYRDLFDITDDLDSKGYEIHGMWIDYLNMISKKGCAQGPHGSDVRDLFRRVRNHYSKKGTMIMTPHQLSSEAKMLRRNGTDNFVQEIANKGYWDSCRTIDQEVDMEIYLNIEKVNGESWLTVQRGKHRKFTITPENDLYYVYKFDPIGGVRDDINGRDMSRRSVGGNTVADGGGEAWYSGI